MSAPQPTKQPTKFGSLHVSVESDSVYFGNNTPVEIRDASMNLVAREQSNRIFKLPEGMYQVSAVLEDGREHSRLVEVRGDENIPVQLGTRAPAPTTAAAASVTVAGASDVAASADSSHAYAVAKSSAAQLRNSRYTQKADAPDDESSSPDESPVTATALLEVKGAKLVRQARNVWTFECVASLDAVATATLQIGERRTEISLPTSPPTMGPNPCAVRIDESPSGAHATAWISPERTVANGLQNMVASGYLSSAASMADQASELLRDKYSDPTGAALAALILRRVGRLTRHQSWIENLARDFAWMPDGKILLATLLVDRRDSLDRALRLALEAAKQRMLYTESYSILLDLLRRWPQEGDRRACLDAIAGLAAYSPYIDWNSNCLSRCMEG
jgi:hypothetical protein